MAVRRQALPGLRKPREMICVKGVTKESSSQERLTRRDTESSSKTLSASSPIRNSTLIRAQTNHWRADQRGAVEAAKRLECVRFIGAFGEAVAAAVAEAFRGSEAKAALKRAQSKRWRVDRRAGRREAFGVRPVYRRFW